MLIPLDNLSRKYNLQVEGILHVGGHWGEEAIMYNNLGYVPVYWIEAEKESATILENHVAGLLNHHVINAVVSDSIGTVKFNHANNGQSSSMLEFGTHSAEHPDVVFESSSERMAVTIDHLLDADLIGQTNFMNLDIQGAELMALKGAVEYLHGVKYIYTEVNDKELYKGCCLTSDLDAWLGMRGFVRREKEMTPHGWGDAFYIKEA